jgi:formylglycine-generating enzyme required for sulfatase activity
MAFRRIDVPHEKTLSDRKIVIGGSEERFAFAEASRYEYIEGSFTDKADARKRYYYLAKYETTVLQLDALAGECKEATRAGLRPATGTTWYDGMRSAQRYTEWLLKEAKGKLPREDGAPGFLRLPTEAEWEFAARGGLEGARFAWGDEHEPGGKPAANTWQGEFPWQNLKLDGFEGTAPVGSFAPNGYGLYDMCGNTWEWTTDWFTTATTDTSAPCCGPPPATDDPFPRRVIKGGSHLCAPNYCLRYRPAARQGEAVDTSTSHIGFRCIVRPG